MKVTNNSSKKITLVNNVVVNAYSSIFVECTQDDKDPLFVQLKNLEKKGVVRLQG